MLIVVESCCSCCWLDAWADDEVEGTGVEAKIGIVDVEDCEEKGFLVVCYDDDGVG